MDFLDHHKNRCLVSASLVAIACLCGLAPVDLAAQNVGNQQIQSMVQGASPQEIMERLRQSGLSRSEVRDQLRRGGYNPSMADAYFDMMEGVGQAPSGGADELLTALENIGVLLRNVEAPFEAGFGLALSDADSLEFLTELLDSNEVESLPPLHEELSAVASEHGYELEIVFVDDGSTDGSWECIEELVSADKRIRAVRFRRNFGKAAALRAGFKLATGEVVFTLDADLQDDPIRAAAVRVSGQIDAAMRQMTSAVVSMKRKG